MSDNSIVSLPVYSEGDPDTRLQTKLVDGNDPTLQLEITAANEAKVFVNNTLTVTATDLDIRNLVFATDKVDVSNSVIALDAATLAALESITVQNGSGGSAVNIQDGGNTITVDGTVELGATTLAALESITVVATDLDIRNLSAAQDSIAIKDSAGNSFSITNPLPVFLSSDPGTEVNNYNTSAALAAGATSNHDYTVTALKTLTLLQIVLSGSDALKVEVQIETAAASGVFNTVLVKFATTADTNIDHIFKAPPSVVAGAKVRLIRTNRATLLARDVYSTISGIEN